MMGWKCSLNDGQTRYVNFFYLEILRFYVLMAFGITTVVF